MAFSWPTLSQIVYRSWRLKRLIAFCTVLPLVFFALMSLIGFGSLGTGTIGLMPIALLMLFVIAGHAVLFPNSNHETAALSVTFTVLALVGPLIAGSIFGWFLFLLFVLYMIWGGQTRILIWQGSTATHRPTFKGHVKTSASLEDARNWFALRPGLKRGQFTCGGLNEDGRFPVWFDTGEMDWLAGAGITDLSQAGIDVSQFQPDEPDGDEPPVDNGTSSFYAQIEVDEPDLQRTLITDSANNIQSVVEHTFKEKRSGCLVTEADAAAAFPWANTMFMWLADFQTDGLIHLAALLEKRESPAIRAAHNMSLLALFSGWVMKRFILRGIDQEALSEDIGAVEEADRPMEVSEQLKALLRRLGPDYEKQGFTKGPLPVVSLEEFFDGNDDDGSFQGAPVSTARAGLSDIRARDEVADVRLGITQWEGPSTWPLAELIYFVTSAQVADVKTWLKDANIWVSELRAEADDGYREGIEVPADHRVICAWID